MQALQETASNSEIDLNPALSWRIRMCTLFIITKEEEGKRLQPMLMSNYRLCNVRLSDSCLFRF